MTGGAACCARAATGHVAAAPPSRVMNSRRFTGLLSSGREPHITTPLRENGAVECGKTDLRMAEVGHPRRFKREVGMTASPQ